MELCIGIVEDHLISENNFAIYTDDEAIAFFETTGYCPGDACMFFPEG